MPSKTLTDFVLEGFCDQLSKEAALPAAVQSVLRPGRLHGIQAGLGSGLGLGLGAGLVGGGSIGGISAYRDARREGAGHLQAATSALGGAVHGSLRGAAIGAAAGAGGGALLGGLAPGQVSTATKALAKRTDQAGSFSRFGQRQVHSLTGWRPGGSVKSIESIGVGAAHAREAVSKATAALGKSPEMDALVRARAAGDSAAASTAEAALRKGPGAALARAYKGLHASENAQAMGLTNLPGYAKSMYNNGVVGTIGAGMREQWASSGAKGKALMIGLPALQAHSVLSTQPNDGTGSGERLGRLAGGTIGAMAAPMSLAGGLVLGQAFERAGGAMGRGVDRIRGKRPMVPQEPTRPPATEPSDAGQAAAERVYGTGYGGSETLE